jgi:hypothetical protein
VSALASFCLETPLSSEDGGIFNGNSRAGD